MVFFQLRELKGEYDFVKAQSVYKSELRLAESLKVR